MSDAFPPGSVAVVLGTRPEIIKLAPVITLLGEAARTIHSGQHYDVGLSASFFDSFDLPGPSAVLGVGGKSRGSQIGEAVAKLDALFAADPPRLIVVQGDTNTALAGALAGNAREIPVVHVEAGLRSFDRRMPEEHNRVLADHVSDYLAAPTEVSRQNLLDEGISDSQIEVTGNTIIEAVGRLLPHSPSRTALLQQFDLSPNEFVLATFHRPENVDDPVRWAQILHQLNTLDFPVVLPLHPRSLKRTMEFGLADRLETMTTIDPIRYEQFLALAAEAAFLVSDSGGVQEEVTVLKRPVIVVRRSTERPEVIGTFAQLIEPHEIGETQRSWLTDVGAIHRELEEIPSPYGDSRAAERIVATMAAL